MLKLEPLSCLNEPSAAVPCLNPQHVPLVQHQLEGKVGEACMASIATPHWLPSNQIVASIDSSLGFSSCQQGAAWEAVHNGGRCFQICIASIAAAFPPHASRHTTVLADGTSLLDVVWNASCVPRLVLRGLLVMGMSSLRPLQATCSRKDAGWKFILCSHGVFPQMLCPQQGGQMGSYSASLQAEQAACRRNPI